MQHTSKDKPKNIEKCSLPFTAVKEVDMIVTELGVMEITSEGILLTELAPGVSIEDIQNVTEAKLIISDHLKVM